MFYRRAGECGYFLYAQYQECGYAANKSQQQAVEERKECGGEYADGSVKDERGQWNHDKVSKEKVGSQSSEVIEHERGGCKLCGQRRSHEICEPLKRSETGSEQPTDGAGVDENARYGHERQLKSHVPQAQRMDDEHDDGRQRQRVHAHLVAVEWRDETVNGNHGGRTNHRRRQAYHHGVGPNGHEAEQVARKMATKEDQQHEVEDGKVQPGEC